MPHTRSAAKRLRQNEERRIRNKDRMTELKTLKKRIVRAVTDGKKDEAESLYRDYSKRVDQAASGSALHRNTASRAKSRTAQLIAKGVSAAAVKAAKPAKSTKPAK